MKRSKKNKNKLNPRGASTTIETVEGASAILTDTVEDTSVTLENPATPAADTTETESLADLVNEVEGLAMDSPAPGSTLEDGQEEGFETVKRKFTGAQRRRFKKGEIPTATRPTVTGNKRRNEEGSTTPSPVVKKRQKVMQKPVSYAGIASDYKLALIPEGYPDCGFNMEQFRGLNNLMMRLIEEHYRTKGQDFEINFDGAYMDGGAIIMNCLDQNTKTWLATDINGVELGGLKVKTSELADLIPMVRAGVFVPGEKVEGKDLLRRIGNQNLLDTKRWIVLDQQKRETGHFVTVKLPERDLDLIMERKNGRLSYSFFKLNLTSLRKKKREETATAEPPIPSCSKGEEKKKEPRAPATTGPKSSVEGDTPSGAESREGQPVSGLEAAGPRDPSSIEPGSEPAQTSCGKPTGSGSLHR